MNGGKVRFRWAVWIDARLERWNDNEALVALVSIERRIPGSGMSLHREIQSEHFFRAGYFRAGHSGCPKSEMETNLVCRQA
ncbi:hypothetical protein Pla52o_16930 [Novipirellula galeiformis]|uniref:Uncharacterized protein n=1 Tax=Novipirellula galeiformis TaxID=2528004 RepID=A0A5C6CM15_9BACT|nr:hypothetical protein Pla52o_16930 [Novipirellula galeiformis]